MNLWSEIIELKILRSGSLEKKINTTNMLLGSLIKNERKCKVIKLEMNKKTNMQEKFKDT